MKKIRNMLANWLAKVNAPCQHGTHPSEGVCTECCNDAEVEA